MTTTPLIDAVESFLLADSWGASRAVVDAEPQLLGDEALELVGALVEEARQVGDERMTRLLEEHLATLRRWRDEDCEPAADFVLGDALAELAETPSNLAEMPRRVALCRRILAAVDPDDDPELWALVQASLATALLLSPVGDRPGNVEEAVAAYERALEILPDSSPERARTLNNFGQALLDRFGGEQPANLERAIDAFREALEGFDAEADREEVGQTLNNLGNALNRRQRGRRDDNREEAISCYSRALKVLPAGREAALASVNLGIVLMERIPGDPIANLGRAVEAFESALAMLDPGMQPIEWANAQTNLGNALQRRAAITDDAALLEQAIAAYESAAEVLTGARALRERALVLANLGNALLARAGGVPGDDVERAIACYERALEFLSPEAAPHDWGQVQNNLGHAYRARGSSDRAGDLERAIAAYEHALEVLTEEAAPAEHAQAKKNLGTAYLQRLTGDPAENRERALDLYREALAVRERVYGPEHQRVASVLYSISKVQRKQGEFEDARESLERALAIDETAGGSDKLARRYRSLARTAREQGDLAASERALERALDVDEELHGAAHPAVLDDLVQLAEVRALRGGGTTDLVQRAVVVGELGGNAVQRQALDEIAELLRHGGDMLAAERTLEHAVAIDETLFGPEHPRVANTLFKLAQVLQQAQDVAGARTTLERAAKIQEATREGLAPQVSAALATLSELIRPGQSASTDMQVHVRSSRQLPAPEPVKLRFTDELRGRVQIAEGSGWPASGPQRMTVSVEVEVPDAARALSDQEAVATATGRVRCAPFGGERAIDRGWCTVVLDPATGAPDGLFYRLCFEDDEHAYTLRGVRRIVGDLEQGDDALSATLTLELFARGRDEQDEGPDAIAAGTLRVRHLDFVRQVSTLKAEGASGPVRVAVLDAYGKVLLGAQWDQYAERVIGASG